MTKLLLCCDLDRTVLPNGKQPESPEARPLFRALAKRPEVTLAYVSGRNKSLLVEAIDEYDLPVPDFAIGDVGTTIYEVDGDAWSIWDAWSDEIASDWSGREHDELASQFHRIDALTLQEPTKQNTYKLSYYAPINTDHQALLADMQRRLDDIGVQASLIWSIDEAKAVGLLDVLPRHATKDHAIRFLMERKGFDEESTVFAGDSGNDMPALTSGLQAVLVRNAHADVRAEAMRLVRERNIQDRLYIAGGNLLGMNGNYSAGILEGLVHFIPEVMAWIADANVKT